MHTETGMSGSIITFKGITPKIHPSVFICEGVKIIGDVEIGEDCSIWYNTVVRGDVNYIRIGKGTNIQDLSMLHVTKKYYPLTIGDNVVVGHSVTLHGATIHNNCLIGIGALVLDGSIIHSSSIVAAGAVIIEGFIVPERTLVAGVPAKVIRRLTDEDIERINTISRNYKDYVQEYRLYSNLNYKNV